MNKSCRRPKPQWLRRKLPTGPTYEKVRSLVKNKELATVCQEAMCPNQFECYGQGTATFMIMGERCTRNCTFCAVGHGPLGPPDPQEPQRVAEAVASMQLKYSVITSVTRDDLSDGGASHFAATIRAVRHLNPKTLIEVLIPDLQGDHRALATIIKARPDVLNHNIETVHRLYPTVRPEADYRRSLELLRTAKTLTPRPVTKSGLMIGLGERTEELELLFQDLLASQCDVLTVGQYLQPSTHHLKVVQYVPPDEFKVLATKALAMGFKAVASAPFVRSSFEAESLFRQAANHPHP